MKEQNTNELHFEKFSELPRMNTYARKQIQLLLL